MAASRSANDRLLDGAGLYVVQGALGLGSPMATAAAHYAFQPIGEIAQAKGIVGGDGKYLVDLIGTSAFAYAYGGVDSFAGAAMLTVAHGALHMFSMGM